MVGIVIWMWMWIEDFGIKNGGEEKYVPRIMINYREFFLLNNFFVVWVKECAVININVMRGEANETGEFVEYLMIVPPHPHHLRIRELHPTSLCLII